MLFCVLVFAGLQLGLSSALTNEEPGIALMEPDHERAALNVQDSDLMESSGSGDIPLEAPVPELMESSGSGEVPHEYLTWDNPLPNPEFKESSGSGDAPHEETNSVGSGDIPVPNLEFKESSGSGEVPLEEPNTISSVDLPSTIPKQQIVPSNGTGIVNSNLTEAENGTQFGPSTGPPASGSAMNNETVTETVIVPIDANEEESTNSTVSIPDDPHKQEIDFILEKIAVINVLLQEIEIRIKDTKGFAEEHTSAEKKSPNTMNDMPPPTIDPLKGSYLQEVPHSIRRLLSINSQFDRSDDQLMETFGGETHDESHHHQPLSQSNIRQGHDGFPPHQDAGNQQIRQIQTIVRKKPQIPKKAGEIVNHLPPKSPKGNHGNGQDGVQFNGFLDIAPEAVSTTTESDWNDFGKYGDSSHEMPDEDTPNNDFYPMVNGPQLNPVHSNINDRITDNSVPKTHKKPKKILIWTKTKDRVPEEDVVTEEKGQQTPERKLYNVVLSIFKRFKDKMDQSGNGDVNMVESEWSDVKVLSGAEGYPKVNFFLVFVSFLYFIIA